MEGLFCVLALFLGVLPLGLLAWIASISSATHRLQQRVNDLEEQVRQVSAMLAAAPAAPPSARTAWTRGAEAQPEAQKEAQKEAPGEPLRVPQGAPEAGEPSAVDTLPPITAPARPEIPAAARAEARPEIPAPPAALSTLVPGVEGPPRAGSGERPATGKPPEKPPGKPPEPPRPPGPLDGPEHAPPPGAGVSAERLGLWVLSAAGASLLLMAAMFAFREAIAAGWIGPGVRFLLGVAVGMGAWVASGLLFSRRYVVPAGALGGAGSAVLYGALYAGIARYGLLSQPVAFSGMVLVTVCTMIGAVHQGSRLQATLGAIGGYMTPILLSTGENKALAFFFYLTLLNSGLIYAARRRDWADQVALAGLITPLLYLGWVAKFHAPDQQAVGLAGALLLASPFLSGGMIGRDWRAEGKAKDAAQTAAWAAGAVLLLVGGVYVFPADPMRIDPISGAPLSWDPGPLAALATAYLFGVALILNAPGRWIRGAEGWLFAAFGAVFPLILMVVHATGWAGVTDPQWGPVGLALIGMPLLIAAVGGKDGWGGPAATGVAALIAAVITAGSEPSSGWILAHALGIGLPPALLLRVIGPRLMLPAAAFAGPLILLSAWQRIDQMPGPILGAAALLYAAWFLPPFAGALAGGGDGGDGKDKDKDRAGVMAAALIGLFLFEPLRRVWEAGLGDGAIGLLPLLLGAALLAGGSLLIQRRMLTLDSPEMGVILGLVLLGASVSLPLQLERTWLTLGWAVEVALLSLLHPRVRQPILTFFAWALTGAVAFRLFLVDDAWFGHGGEGMILLNWSLYTWGVPLLCMLVAARNLSRPPPTLLLPSLQYVLGIAMGFALLNVEISHAFAHDGQLSFLSEDLAQEMTRSIAWACFGLLLILIGVWRESRWTRLAGLMFALLGVAKACLFDLWRLSGFYRVGSFFCMAVALMLAAIAFQRMVLRDEADRKDGGKDGGKDGKKEGESA